MPAPPHIIDVHPADNPFAVTPSDILSGLSHPINQKYLPTILLYDEKGLRLYDDITTFAKEYYLFAAEEEILKNKADEIVRVMHGGHDEAVDGEVVLELGAGALRKTSHILLALSRLRPAASPITYFALDLEQRELERTISQINMSDNIGKHLSGKVDTKGIWGTYDDGLKFVREGGLIASPSSDELVKRVEESLAANNTTRDASPAPKSVTSGSTESSSPGPLTPNSESASNLGDKPMHLLFLGSSLGNFSREAGTSFLESLPLRPGSGDTLLIGLDHDNSKEAVESAYNDSAGYTKKFIMNGLTAAGRILGDEHLFDEKNWEYVNKYDADLRRHEAFVKSKRVQVIKVPSTGEEHKVAEGETVKIEESFKYSDADAYQLFTLAGLRPIQRWSNNANQYSLWLLERPLFHFSLLSQPTTTNTESSPFGVPTRADWNRLWACWDFITLQMIPLEMLHRRPIDLRHICLFYIGHIPTFLDIHLSRLLGEKNTEPEVFKYIFERGIDPNVDDPTVCHDHSEVPEKEEDWPSLPALLDFRDRVRERLMNLYDRFECSDPSFLTRKVARVLFMTHEHEALHAETLLYMLVQSSPGSAGGTISPPGFARPPFEQLAKEQWNVKVSQPSETTVTLGPTKIDIGHDDSEKDDLEKSVAGHEFGWDNEHPKREVEVPEFRIEWKPVTNGEFYEFWTKQGKEKSIRLPASWVEAEDGTVSVRTLYGPIPLDIANNWPVMADYEAMSAYAVVKGGRLPTDCELRLFMDKFHHGYSGGDANVGFRNWHPVPATTSAAGKKGHNGGVWEWTSTVFSEHQGFEASKLYPGYSKDFFDGCHQVVLGGSFATIPRLSERRSVKNWYQKNYPYAFIGGRVAYDV